LSIVALSLTWKESGQTVRVTTTFGHFATHGAVRTTLDLPPLIDLGRVSSSFRTQRAKSNITVQLESKNSSRINGFRHNSRPKLMLTLEEISSHHHKESGRGRSKAAASEGDSPAIRPTDQKFWVVEFAADYCYHDETKEFIWVESNFVGLLPTTAVK
jgi:hypothetical protein